MVQKRAKSAVSSARPAEALSALRLFYSDRPERIDVTVREARDRLSLIRAREGQMGDNVVLATLTLADAEALAKTILQAVWMAGPHDNFTCDVDASF